MSQENVEFVRNFYAILDRGDVEPWNLLLPDFVFDFSRRLIDPVTFGPDKASAFYRDLTGPWRNRVRVELEELIDAGDKVLVLIRYSAQGELSGVEVDALVWNVWTFRDGRPLRWTYFGDDRAEALAAVGLSE
jgi:ketosteroid isomerase-like protein